MTTLSFAFGAPASSHAAQSSTNWRDLVLYDVIPEACRHVNDDCFAFKDYGDAAGDAYYAMRALLPPLLCDVCHEEPPGGDSFCARYNYIAVGTCYSEQATPGPQVARKISVQVPADVPFGTYGACNAPEGAEGDAICHYECVSEHGEPDPALGIGVQRLTRARMCNAEVGRNITREPAEGRHADAVRALQYDYHLCTRLDGHWYSSGNSSYAGRSWRSPTLVKAIDSACQQRVLYETVQQHGGTACWEACPRGTEDTTDPCYIRCFYENLLGRDADSSSFVEGGGMTAAEIEAAWLRGFDVCPDYPMGDAPTHEEPAVAQEARSKLAVIGKMLQQRAARALMPQ